MRNLILFALLALVACVPSGGIRPTVATAPPWYLKDFPLGQVTETELIQNLGPMLDASTKDERVLVYQLGTAPFGVRSWTYMLRSGVVVDVRYNDDGPYNGSTAKVIQGKR